MMQMAICFTSFKGADQFEPVSVSSKNSYLNDLLGETSTYTVPRGLDIILYQFRVAKDVLCPGLSRISHGTWTRTAFFTDSNFFLRSFNAVMTS